jgi:hypothetical protein
MSKVYWLEDKIYCNCTKDCPSLYRIKDLALRLTHKKNEIECYNPPYKKIKIEDLLRKSPDFKVKIGIKTDELYRILRQIKTGLSEKDKLIKVSPEGIYTLAVAYKEAFFFTDAIEAYAWAINYTYNADPNVNLNVFQSQIKEKMKKCIEIQKKHNGLEAFLDVYRWGFLGKEKYKSWLSLAELKSIYNAKELKLNDVYSKNNLPTRN